MTDLDECSLQYKSAGTKHELDLIIGFDFGTSTSKIVIRIPARQDFCTYADFYAYPQVVDGKEFLLPTQVWYSPTKGQYSLRHKEGWKEINGLKEKLIEESKTGKIDLKSHCDTIAYLALVMRHVREDVLSRHYRIIKEHRSNVWSLNIGVPSVEDGENFIYSIFGKLATTAWSVSQMPTEMVTKECIKAQLVMNVRPECNINAMPEIVGATMGYKNSDRHRQGTHMMIDVGASTVDVCSFYIFDSEAESIFGILDSSVELAGADKLHESRLESMFGMIVELETKLKDEIRRSMKLPSRSKYEICGDYIERRLDCADQKHMERIVGSMSRSFAAVKQRRNPLDNNVSKGGTMPIMLFGGGIRDRTFRSKIEDVAKGIRASLGINCICIDDASHVLLDTLNDADKARMVVAWGLSYQELDIGKILQPHDLPDIKPTKHEFDDSRFVTKDQV